jgi:hypothetical protein
MGSPSPFISAEAKSKRDRAVRIQRPRQDGIKWLEVAFEKGRPTMLIRDPYFLLYVLHVAALFVIALWPRLTHSPAAGPAQEAMTPPNPAAGSSHPAGLVRHWSLVSRSRDLGRFQELEAAWREECTAKFSHILQRISLV